MKIRILTLLCSTSSAPPLFVYADSGGGGSDRPDKSDPGAAVSDYDTGYKHLKDGKYKAAIKSFKRAIKDNPNHAMAYNNMAYSYRKLGQLDEAIPLYEKALAIDPTWPKPMSTWAKP